MHVHFNPCTLSFVDDGFKCKESQFIIIPHKVYIDFEHYNVITKLIWREKINSHRSLISCSGKGYTRIETFVQINNKPIEVVVKARLKSTIKKDLISRHK
jgi:hypothetical protein